MRTFHIDKVFEYFPKILPYLSVTFEYVVLSVLFGFMIGALLLKMRIGKVRILSAISSIYVTVMRCVPSIVLLFIVYFGAPMIGNSLGYEVSNDPIVYVIITFTLALAASGEEVMRAAYESVDKGQLEAGVACGLTPFQTFYRVILPQAFVTCIPNIGSTVIFMFKEGALAYTIGLQDVMGRGYSISGLYGHAYILELYVALTFIYWPITLILEKTFAELEKRFSIQHKISKIQKQKIRMEKRQMKEA